MRNNWREIRDDLSRHWAKFNALMDGEEITTVQGWCVVLIVAAVSCGLFLSAVSLIFGVEL